MAEIQLTITNDDSVELIEHLCNVTGLTPACLVALLIRKYGGDLQAWIGSPPAITTPVPVETGVIPENKKPPLELPTDPGEDLKPVEL